MFEVNAEALVCFHCSCGIYLLSKESHSLSRLVLLALCILSILLTSIREGKAYRNVFTFPWNKVLNPKSHKWQATPLQLSCTLGHLYFETVFLSCSDWYKLVILSPNTGIGIIDTCQHIWLVFFVVYLFVYIHARPTIYP